MVTSDRRKWWALGLLSVVQFMVVLDIAIVNVALPSIQVDLGFSEQNLQWVISAYALVFGGFLLLGGRAADLLGRRRIFLAGLVVFTLASLFAGLAWSEASLISARAIQGLGAAVITPAALSILSVTWRVISSGDAPGHCAPITMVLMVKSGSSCRPSCRYANRPAAMKAIMKYQTSERCPSAQSERLKVFMAWRPVRCGLAVLV